MGGNQWGSGMMSEALFQHWGDIESRPRVILGRDRELLWSNSAADAALVDAVDVLIEAGRFRLVNADEMVEFERFLAAAARKVSAWCARQRDGGAMVFRVWLIEVDDFVANGLVFHPTGAAYVRHWADFSRVFGLTPTEFKVCLRLLDGLKIETAAAELGITVGTARIHVRNLYGKFDVSSREAMFRLLAPFRVA